MAHALILWAISLAPWKNFLVDRYLNTGCHLIVECFLSSDYEMTIMVIFLCYHYMWTVSGVCVMSCSVGNPYMCSGVQKSFYKKCHRREYSRSWWEGLAQWCWQASWHAHVKTECLVFPILPNLGDLEGVQWTCIFNSVSCDVCGPETTIWEPQVSKVLWKSKDSFQLLFYATILSLSNYSTLLGQDLYTAVFYKKLSPRDIIWFNHSSQAALPVPRFSLKHCHF